MKTYKVIDTTAISNSLKDYLFDQYQDQQVIRVGQLNSDIHIVSNACKQETDVKLKEHYELLSVELRSLVGNMAENRITCLVMTEI